MPASVDEYGEPRSADGIAGLLIGDHPDLAVVGVCDVADERVAAAMRAGARGCVDTGADGAELARAVVAAGHGQPVLSGPMLMQLHRGLRTEALTDREREVRGLMEQGLPDKIIAERLVLSVKTVEKHAGAVLRKTGARNRTELAALRRPVEAEVGEVLIEDGDFHRSGARAPRVGSPCRRQEATRASRSAESDPRSRVRRTLRRRRDQRHQRPDDGGRARGRGGAPAPVILQTSVKHVQMTGAGRHVRDVGDDDRRESSVPVALHLDHCPDREVISRLPAPSAGTPSCSTPRSCRSRRTGASASRSSPRRAATARDVEGEIEGFKRTEEMTGDEAQHVQSLETVVDFVQATGVDVFAPAIGNAHGDLQDRARPSTPSGSPTSSRPPASRSRSTAAPA